MSTKLKHIKQRLPNVHPTTMGGVEAEAKVDKEIRDSLVNVITLPERLGLYETVLIDEGAGIQQLRKIDVLKEGVRRLERIDRYEESLDASKSDKASAEERLREWSDTASTLNAPLYAAKESIKALGTELSGLRKQIKGTSLPSPERVALEAREIEIKRDIQDKKQKLKELEKKKADDIQKLKSDIPKYNKAITELGAKLDSARKDFEPYAKAYDAVKNELGSSEQGGKIGRMEGLIKILPLLDTMVDHDKIDREARDLIYADLSSGGMKNVVERIELALGKWKDPHELKSNMRAIVRELSRLRVKSGAELINMAKLYEAETKNYYFLSLGGRHINKVYKKFDSDKSNFEKTLVRFTAQYALLQMAEDVLTVLDKTKGVSSNVTRWREMNEAFERRKKLFDHAYTKYIFDKIQVGRLEGLGTGAAESGAGHAMSSTTTSDSWSESVIEYTNRYEWAREALGSKYLLLVAGNLTDDQRLDIWSTINIAWARRHRHLIPGLPTEAEIRNANTLEKASSMSYLLLRRFMDSNPKIASSIKLTKRQAEFLRHRIPDSAELFDFNDPVYGVNFAPNDAEIDDLFRKVWEYILSGKTTVQTAVEENEPPAPAQGMLRTEGSVAQNVAGTGNADAPAPGPAPQSQK